MKCAVLLGILLAALALFVDEAAAGQYEVGACEAANGANAAWTFATSDPLTVDSTQSCQQGRGLGVFELLGPGPLATLGDAGWWRFEAAPTTAIVRLTGSRYLHTFSDPGWRAEIRADEIVLERCVRETASTHCRRGTEEGGWVDFAIARAGAVSVGGQCVPDQYDVCERGSSLHSMEAYLYGATVTLEENEAPSVDVGASGLADGAWRTGPAALSVTANDNTGVRVRRVLVDGEEVGRQEAPAAVDGGCRTVGSGVAWTYTLPCAGARGANGAITTTFDPRDWPQGVRTLRVEAVDTAGNVKLSDPVTVRIDTRAPAEPDVVATSGWSAAPTASVVVPATSNGSPVTTAEVTLCPTGSACSTVVRSVVPGRTSTLALPALPDGTSTIDVRLRDDAGNLGAPSGPVTLRKDASAPTVTDVRPSGGTVPAGTRLVPSATASDPHSGPRALELEVSVDGGAFAPTTGVTAEPGRRYVFRARSDDGVGNLSPWVEGAAVTVEAAPPAEPTRPEDPPAAPQPVVPTTTTPTVSSPSCRVTITRATVDAKRRVRIEGRAPSGKRVTVKDGRGVQRSTIARAGRFVVTLTPRARRWTTLTATASARSCAVARRVVRRMPVRPR